jgi:hypothetical protein
MMAQCSGGDFPLISGETIQNGGEKTLRAASLCPA